MILRTTLGLLLLSAVTGRAQDALPEKTLQHLQAATVFVVIKTSAGQQTGSGFLVDREDDVGYVVTNAHVVTVGQRVGRNISCVFNSGTAKETTTAGSVVALSPSRDLALLRVRHGSLPDPIAWQRTVSVRETMAVYAVGFPFGDALSTSRRHPAVTISRATVSSIRRNDYGDVMLLQLDGGVNPGNSGGPVVDSSGNLIGVAVAKVGGTQIAFAIPLEKLSDVLQGEVAGLRFARTESTKHRLEMDVTAVLADPLNRLRTVQLYVIERDAVGKEPKPEADGRWGAVSPDLRPVVLEINGGIATGKLVLRIEDDKPKKYVVQVRIVRSDRKTVFSGPSDFVFARSGPVGEYPSRLPWEGLGIHPPSLETPLVERPLPGKIADLVVGGGGRYLIVRLADKSEAAVFDVNQAKVVRTLRVPIDGLLAASLNRLIAVSPFDNRLYAWSLDDFEEQPPVDLPVRGAIQAVAVGHASPGPLLIRWGLGAQDSERAYLTLLNLRTMEPLLFERMTIKPGSDDERRDPLRRDGKFSPLRRKCGDRLTIRAAGCGTAFSVFSSITLEMLVLRGSEADYYVKEASVSYAVPTMDGDEICTSSTIYRNDLSKSRGDRAVLPTYAPPYLLTFPAVSPDLLPANGGVVMDPIMQQTLAKVPDLAEMAIAAPGFHGGDMTVEKRYHCIPQAQLLVTVPPSNDRFVLRQLIVEPDTSAATSGTSADTDGPSEESAASAQRTWTDKSGRFEILATFVSYSNGMVKLKKGDGTVIEVPIEKLSEGDAKFIRELSRRTGS